MLRAIIVGIAVTASLAVTESSVAQSCHQRHMRAHVFARATAHRGRPVLGAPARVVARVAEARVIRRTIAAPFRVLRRGCHAACQ